MHIDAHALFKELSIDLLINQGRPVHLSPLNESFEGLDISIDCLFLYLGFPHIPGALGRLRTKCRFNLDDVFILKHVGEPARERFGLEFFGLLRYLDHLKREQLKLVEFNESFLFCEAHQLNDFLEPSDPFDIL